MKKIITFTFILLLGFTAAAQNKKYIKSQNLTPFVGVWEYRTATETFTVELREGLCSGKMGHIESVYGGYKYVKNGKIIADYLHTVSNTYNTSMPIAADNRVNVPVNMVQGIFYDNKRDKISALMFTFVSGKTNEARWQLFEPEGTNFIIDGVGTMPPLGFDVPVDVIMKKIK